MSAPLYAPMREVHLTCSSCGARCVTHIREDEQVRLRHVCNTTPAFALVDATVIEAGAES